LLDWLVAGNTGAFLALFAGPYDGREPWLADPLQGQQAGQAALSRFAHTYHAWLRQRRARVEPRRMTLGLPGRGESRLVVESILHLEVGGRAVPLPVALVAERKAGGGLQAARLYYSTWPLHGRHQVRPPLLPADPQLPIPDVVGRYQAALAVGDLDGILATFAADGYAREPSGGPYVARGPEALRAFYSGLFAAGGGIPLEHCTLTDDGVACAVEYNVVRLGRHPVPAQAGVAVYERGPDGLLAAARIYDDVDIPDGAAEPGA
jgi:hypothetical protein